MSRWSEKCLGNISSVSNILAFTALWNIVKSILCSLPKSVGRSCFCHKKIYIAITYYYISLKFYTRLKNTAGILEKLFRVSCWCKCQKKVCSKVISPGSIKAKLPHDYDWNINVYGGFPEIKLQHFSGSFYIQK